MTSSAFPCLAKVGTATESLLHKLPRGAPVEQRLLNWRSRLGGYGAFVSRAWKSHKREDHSPGQAA